MRGLFLVEPVVALYAFSSFLIYPLVQQYVYRQLWQQLTNTTYPISDNASRCTQDSGNQSSYHEVSLESMDRNYVFNISKHKGYSQLQIFGTYSMHLNASDYSLCLGNYLCLYSSFTVMAQHKFSFKPFRVLLAKQLK